MKETRGGRPLAARARPAGLAVEGRKSGMGEGMRRFMIVRTFPPGALDNVDSATKRKVNTTNEANGARWIRSYANADRTRTFCVYEGIDEGSVRRAAAANGLPIDTVTEVPVDLLPN
jgi:hypothetical protein